MADKLSTDLAEAVLAASLYWTGEDEVSNPSLKTARTLAGLVLERERLQNSRPNATVKTG